jgi:murein DD-endopeptidase MepM/ murein hydrolase activator NlpD
MERNYSLFKGSRGNTFTLEICGPGGSPRGPPPLFRSSVKGANSFWIFKERGSCVDPCRRKENVLKLLNFDLKEKYMKHFIFALLCSVAVIVSLSPCSMAQDTPSPSPQPVLSLSVRGTPRQGGMLFVTVAGSEKTNEGEATWRGKRYPLLWQKSSLGVMLPVPLDAPAGGHKLKVAVKRAGGSAPEALEKSVQVTAYTYGVQHIWLSESQLAKYDDPQADRDNDAIKKALSHDTTGIAWDRQFIWPIAANISTQFGLKRFYNNDKVPEFHRGFDLPAGTGTPVAAAQRGIVRFARRNLLLHGTTAVIDHGKGIGTLYLHMNSLKVKEGDPVEQGDIIGTVGMTGAGTGPHLHWAAYSQGEPIDPRLLFHLPADWIDR